MVNMVRTLFTYTHNMWKPLTVEMPYSGGYSSQMDDINDKLDKNTITISTYKHDKYYWTILINKTHGNTNHQQLPVIGVARGGHGRAFALPSLNFALPSKLFFYLKFNVAIIYRGSYLDLQRQHSFDSASDSAILKFKVGWDYITWSNNLLEYDSSWDEYLKFQKWRQTRW